MPRIRHTGGHGSILTAKGKTGMPYVVSVDEYRFTNSSGSTQSQTHTIPVAGGWQKDDFVLVLASTSWAVGTPQTPAGFVTPLAMNPNFLNGGLWFLRATSTGNSIGTSTTVLTAGGSVKFVVIVIRGARGIDFGGFEGVTRDGNGRTLTMIGRLANTEGLALFYCNNNGIAGTLSTPPSGMSLVSFSGLGINLSLHSQKVKADDALNKTLTFSNGDSNGGAVVVLVG